MRKQHKAKGMVNCRDAGGRAIADDTPIKNPVAKFAHQFNKAQAYADKSKYRRKAKHSGLEPFAIVSSEMIANGSTVLGRVIVGAN